MPQPISASPSTALDDVIILCSSFPDAPAVAFDVRTGACMKSYARASRGAAGGCAALADAKLLTLSVDKRSIDAHDLMRESLEHASVLAERPSAIATSSDGAYACVGSASGSCAAWDALTGRLLARWKAHFKSVTCVRFSPCNGVIITGGDDGAVHAWRMSSLFDDGGAGGSTATAWRTWTEHALGVRGLAVGRLRGVAGDVTVISASADRTVKMYSLASGSTLRERRLPSAPTCAALDACEATLYVGTVDGRTFEIALNGAPSVGASLDGADARDGVVALEGHSKAVTSVECSRDGATVTTASEDGTARVWDCASRQTTHVLRHPKGSVVATAMVPRWRFSGQGRGDGGAETKRKPTPTPMFSKYLIGAGDRSGVKPWQGPMVMITPRTTKRSREDEDEDEDEEDAVDVDVDARPSASPAAASGQGEDLRARLAIATAAVSNAVAEVEEWKTLYIELKTIVDRQLVDAEVS